ncbi:MAG: MBL fold metallo-hydrolase [Candidatus Gracilibacteria bacterium]|nr:MBL fold metallo-hydrolase [Candidatus Gracilibacteria bacterium]
MQIQFLGAADEVTGSSHLVTVNGKRILLDCGMFQGHRKESIMKNFAFLFDPTEITAVILSHAHIDHSGRLPLLAKNRYRGPVYATKATADLCQYMLRDSAYIQEKDAEYLNRKFPSKETLEPLYITEHAEQILEQFSPQNYAEWFEVTDGVRAKFLDAGHILGSAITILEITENGATHLLGFTGDLGRDDLPILRDPQIPEKLDYLITESTYGDRLHAPFPDAEKELERVINETIARGGKIIIPAFAMERTQEIVYALHLLHQARRIPPLPIYVDSPLATNVTEVFGRHMEDFDDHAWDNFLEQNTDPFSFGNLKYTHSVDESKELNQKHGPIIIISASGMCENGRIVHHLRNNVEDHRNTILIVGYMAEGTLGRKLVEKAPAVKIFGQELKLNAKIEIIDAFSAHADKRGLLKWIGQIKGLQQVFVCHGEQQSALSFANTLKNELGLQHVIVPAWREKIDLL